MDKSWKDKLLVAAERKNEQQEKEFLDLLEQANNKHDIDIARTLMKTFRDIPDYGTQEAVIRTLATYETTIVTQVILEELPRLMEEANEWADALIGSEVEHRPDLLIKTARKMSDDVQKHLRVLLNNEDFQEFYQNAKGIKI